MPYPIEEPIDAEFVVLSPRQARTSFGAALDRQAWITVVIVVTCIFAAICAGAALAAAFVSAS